MSRTVQLDEKRRASFGTEFLPGDSFVREVSGNVVTFRKQEHRPVTAKVHFEKRNGYTVGVLDTPVDEAAIQKALEEFP